MDDLIVSEGDTIRATIKGKVVKVSIQRIQLMFGAFPGVRLDVIHDVDGDVRRTWLMLGDLEDWVSKGDWRKV